MARNWGRLLAADLDDSEKLALCSERAALVWAAFTTPKHDGEGRLEVDDVAILSMCGRFAIVHRWTLEEMAGVRGELEKNGLWRIYKTVDGKLCAEVTNWRNKQRLDRIKRGSDVLDESPEPVGGNSGGTRGENGGNSGGLEGAARASQGKEREEEGKGTQARAREDAPSLDRPAVSGSKKQEAAMLAPALEAAFRIAFDSPHWILTDRHKAKLAPYAGLISSFEDLPAAVAAGVAAVRAQGADERWIVENVIEHLATNPKAGREPRPTNGKPEPDFVPSWIVDLAEEEGISVEEWKAKHAR